MDNMNRVWATLVQEIYAGALNTARSEGSVSKWLPQWCKWCESL